MISLLPERHYNAVDAERSKIWLSLNVPWQLAQSHTQTQNGCTRIGMIHAQKL